MIEIRGIRKSFGDNVVLDGVDMSLEESCIAGLIGPSGGGKSVLLKIIAQVDEPDAGEIRTAGVDGREVSLMFQEGALFDSLSVFDNVAFPLVRGKVPTFILSRATQEEVHHKVDAILDRVGLCHASAKMPGQLSGGMRRRVSLARALVSKPRLVLLDDPTCGLDPVASSVIMDLITELHREYKPTLLMVSHDLRRLLPVVDTVYGLFDGRIRYSGPVCDLIGIDPGTVRKFVSCRYDLT